MSVHLEWKEVPDDPNNVWIVLTALGTVDLPETRVKLAKLQETLDYFIEYYGTSHKFTLLFDFSRCKDFAKLPMLDDIKKFLKKNDPILGTHLRKSYILLRDPSWKFWTKLIFVFHKPKQPYSFKMEDAQLYHALRFKGGVNAS